MYWHKGSRTAFLANPRTASRSVAAALRALGFKKEGAHHSGLGDRRPRTTFCVVRYHPDCLISWGEHLRRPVRDEDSLRWLLENMGRQNLYPEWELGRRLFPWASDSTVNLRFERLEHQLGPFLTNTTGQFLGVGRSIEVDLPHLGKSDRPRMPEIFSPPMIEMVYDQYGDEMDELGYDDPWWEVL